MGFWFCKYLRRDIVTFYEYAMMFGTSVEAAVISKGFVVVTSALHTSKFMLHHHMQFLYLASKFLS